MDSRSTAHRLLFLMPVAAVLHLAVYYARLPERMATHFGPSGAPDGWMSKEAFAAFYVVLMAFLTLLMLGVGALVRVSPDDRINLPNKAYWLAPERRAETVRGAAEAMARFGVATGLLLLGVTQLAFQANLTPDPRLDPALAFLLLGAYFVYTLLWTVRLLRSYCVSEG